MWNESISLSGNTIYIIHIKLCNIWQSLGKCCSSVTVMKNASEWASTGERQKRTMKGRKGGNGEERGTWSELISDGNLENSTGQPSVSILWLGEVESLICNFYLSVASDKMFVGCLTSQQQASVSQGRICSDNFACCHTEIKAADQTFYLIQSQYTDTGPTSPSADPITPGAWHGSHWSASV